MAPPGICPISPTTPPPPVTDSGVTSQPGTSGTYTVLPGDNLSTIASRTGTTVAQLVALNQGTFPSLAHNPDVIEIGWKLRLTGAAQPSPKTPAKPPQLVYIASKAYATSHPAIVNAFAAAITAANGDLATPPQVPLDNNLLMCYIHCELTCS